MRIRSRLSLVLVLVMALAAVTPAIASAVSVNGRSLDAAALKPLVYAGPDRYDSTDASWTSAPTVGGALPSVSWHTLAGVQDQHLFTGDVDWFKVTVTETGTPVTVNVKRLSGQGGSFIDVYASDGSRCATDSIDFGGYADPNDGPRVLGGMSPGWWASGMAKLYFEAPEAGTYYFRHRPAVEGSEGPGFSRDAAPAAANNSVSYELRVVVGDADRLAGNSRYGTAIAVSKQMWNAADDPFWVEGPWGNGVILVSGENYADGLAATSLSLRSGMPVLLTPRDYLPAEVDAEIDRLGEADWNNHWNTDGTPRDNTFTVYICGSDAAVSGTVEQALADNKHVTAIERLEGANRYETAVAIADEASRTALYKRVVPFGAESVRPQMRVAAAFIINGNAWADGLAAGPVAAFADAPVLMVTQNTLPQATADWLVRNDVTHVQVVGGSSVVATSVLEAIAALPTAPAVDRLAGDSRYETAYEVAMFGVNDLGMVGNACTVVSGANPWDALSAGQLSFMTYAPLLLTPKSSLTPYVTDFYDRNGGFSYPSYVVGGEPAVDANTFGDLRDLWKRSVDR